MLSVNKVIVAGNLGRDVELKYTAKGTAVANLSVATSRSWIDRTTKQPQEETEWHSVVLWDKQAEYAAKYAGKGCKVYVEGRNKTEKWIDENNKAHYTTKIIAHDFQLVEGKRDTDIKQNAQPENIPPAPPSNGDQWDDDIPF